MKIAALYDIHGNLPALEAVLQEVRLSGVERIVIGGDVLPGPMPRETLACLAALEIPADYIRGNGDREVLNVMAGGEPTSVPEPFRELIRWTAAQLGAKTQTWMESWPLLHTITRADGGNVCFCHATGRNDSEIFTKETPDEIVQPMFAGIEAPVIVCGHTHMQFDRALDRWRVLNAGSVGMPFDERGAYWLLLGPQPELKCTPYDFEAAAARVRATAYPQAEEFAATNILKPPSTESMLALFTKASLAQQTPMSTASVDIRPLRPADRDDVLDALRASRVFTEEELRVAREVIDAGLETGLDGDYPLFVADVEGRVRGYVCVGKTPLTRGTWHLYWICVHPSSQGLGLGHRLQREAERFVQSRGGERILLETSSTPGYAVARAFYERAGYSVVGRVVDFYRPGDDCIMYCKVFAGQTPS